MVWSTLGLKTAIEQNRWESRSDEFIRLVRGDKTAMRHFVKIPWPLVRNFIWCVCVSFPVYRCMCLYVGVQINVEFFCGPRSDKNDVRVDGDDVSTDVIHSNIGVTTADNLLPSIRSRRHATVRRCWTIPWIWTRPNVRRCKTDELCPLYDDIELSRVQLQQNPRPLRRVPKFFVVIRAHKWLCRIRGDRFTSRILCTNVMLQST